MSFLRAKCWNGKKGSEARKPGKARAAQNVHSASRYWAARMSVGQRHVHGKKLFTTFMQRCFYERPAPYAQDQIMSVKGEMLHMTMNPEKTKYVLYLINADREFFGPFDSILICEHYLAYNKYISDECVETFRCPSTFICKVWPRHSLSLGEKDP